DGRKDSLWSQALGPMEDAREHGGTRTFYAHLVERKYRDRYERIFGPLPDLSGLPERAGPKGTPEEQEAWASMSAAEQDAVNRVYANIGKAIGAFERSILPGETQFDRFARAVARSEERRVGQKGELGGRRSREQHRAEG